MWGKARADPNIVSPLPNKSDSGQAGDQTTVLLFSPKIFVYVSLIIIVSHYIKN